jgi:hypothetical protein
MTKPRMHFQLGEWHCVLLHPTAAPARGFYVGSGPTLEAAWATYETAKRIAWMMELTSA